MKDTQTYREDEGTPGGLPNGQSRQPAQDLSPADGADGFVGSNTGPALGMNVVSGKKGYSKDMPIWSQQSSTMGVKDNTGSQDGNESFGGQDSTDELATYKKPQTDEGLIQTYRTADGAGDAGPVGSDEPEGRGIGEVNPDTQSTPGTDSGDHSMSDMPQTEFTHNSGGGAPLFKHGA